MLYKYTVSHIDGVFSLVGIIQCYNQKQTVFILLSDKSVTPHSSYTYDANSAPPCSTAI